MNKRITANELFYDFLVKPYYPFHQNSTIYKRAVEYRWAKYVYSAFGHKKVAHITADDWRNLVLDHRDRGNTGIAKNLIVLCGCFYKNAQQHRDFPNITNPLSGIRIHLPDHKESNILPLAELSSFDLDHEVCTAMGKWLILTGGRVSDTQRLTWDRIKDDHVIIGNRGEMKRKDSAHHLPLIPAMLDIIEPLVNQKKPTSPYVFFGKRNYCPYHPVGFGKRLRETYPGITAHSLRHSMASGCAESGISPYEISLVLHHAIPGMTNKLYIHGQQLDTKRECLTKWAKVLGWSK